MESTDQAQLFNKIIIFFLLHQPILAFSANMFLKNYSIHTQLIISLFFNHELSLNIIYNHNFMSLFWPHVKLTLSCLVLPQPHPSSGTA